MKTRMNQIRMNQNGAAAYSAQGIRTRPALAPAGIAALLNGAAGMLRLWRSRRRERRVIRRLDDHMLRDIGLDRFTAEQVGQRPFWKA
jgi:uncharacterized protein YjiS (DUF1127 family)